MARCSQPPHHQAARRIGLQAINVYRLLLFSCLAPHALSSPFPQQSTHLFSPFSSSSSSSSSTTSTTASTITTLRLKLLFYPTPLFSRYALVVGAKLFFVAFMVVPFDGACWRVRVSVFLFVSFGLLPAALTVCAGTLDVFLVLFCFPLLLFCLVLSDLYFLLLIYNLVNRMFPSLLFYKVFQG